MKTISALRLSAISLLIAGLSSFSFAAISAASDTLYITGGTRYGLENAGALETAINGDTTASGARNNPNRVYALYEGQYYVQQNPLNIHNATGTLTIVGVPSASGTTKPVWMMLGNGGPVLINSDGCNVVYGSLKFENIHYVAQQLDGTLNNENFLCGTQGGLPQSLTINNCLFEFVNIDLFDCTDEPGAIGGWPHGAKFRITNSYFRNLFRGGQWWGSRIFQCKHPIDSLWIENNTITGGGLTFLMQNSLTAFAYFNHNTIVNNMKYWILSPYYIELYVTNNIFINQNWVGEDTSVVLSEQDPDFKYVSTINIDTTNSPGSTVVVQPKYSAGGGGYTDAVSLKNMKVYISNNINYSDPLLTPYYTNAGYAFDPAPATTPLSYINWGYNVGPLPHKVENIPCEWMNARTKAFFTVYAPGSGNSSPGCCFIDENTSTANPNTVTPGIADAATALIMAQWNQNMWNDPLYPTIPDILHSKYIFGDYDPTTIPGTKTEDGTGITKFTDLTENFSQSSHLSSIDGLPIGSLIWDDAQFAAYNSAHDWQNVQAGYLNVIGGLLLSQNSVSFGSVLAHATKTDSLTITNYYTHPIIIDSVYTSTQWFTTVSVHDTIAQGGSVNLFISFTPDSLTTYSDTLYISNNSAFPLRKVPLSGSKAVPQIGVSQSDIAFGSVRAFTTKTDTIKITNSSSALLRVDSVYTRTRWFTTLSKHDTVAQSDTVRLLVSFTPDSSITYADTLYILSNSLPPLTKIPLSGSKAVPQIVVSQTIFDFGSILADSAKTDTIRITTDSPALLFIDSVYTKTKWFMTASVHDTVNRGDTVRVLISFHPDTLKIYWDTLYILSNATIPLTKIPLGGTGDSNSIVLAVLHIKPGIPKSYELSQNYPNPFNPSTTLQYGLPARSSVRLVIYNVLGQVVKILINAEQQAGFQSVVWNANVSSGMYFYRLEAMSMDNPSKRFVETRKMLLLK
jgi:Secretion system C-terminal sorting domain